MKPFFVTFKSQPAKMVAMAVCILFFSSTTLAVNKISVNNGNWSDAATWLPTGVPTSSDSVTISSGTTVVMDMSVSSCLYLKINGIAEWQSNRTINATQAVLNNGTLTFSGTIGSLAISGNLFVSGDTSTVNGVNLHISDSTIVDAGAVLKTTATNGAKDTKDLIINGSWDCLVSDGWKISGNLVFNGTNFISGGGTYTFTGTNQNISGNPITIEKLKIDTEASITNQTSLTITGNLTGLGTFSEGINSTFSIGTQSAKFDVTFFNASAEGNTVVYNHEGIQKIRVPNDGAYYNLTLSGSNTKSTTGTLTIFRNIDIQSKLDVTTNNDSIKLSGNWNNTGIFDARNAWVILNGNNPQTVYNPSSEYFYKLFCSGNGTKNLASAIAVDSTLQIDTASTLDVSPNNYQIALKGNWINNGAFNSEKGTLLLDGNKKQSIEGTNTTAFYNITLNNTAGTQIYTNENLIGTLTLTNGTFISTGKKFTLLSDADGTARIATIPSSANFTGTITMQRFLPLGNNGWRFLASAVNGATLQQWSDCFATSGFTGSTDPSNSFTSIYRYDETNPGTYENGYVAATNVSNPILNTGGYWCYVGPTPLVVKVSGPPNKFTQTFSPTYTSNAGASQDGWNMISNTYPSAIDWNATSGWTKTNINDAVYIWNSQLQQYASYVSGVGTNGGSNIIPSSQSFWIQVNGNNPKLTMNEDVKTAANQAFTKINSDVNEDQQSIHLRITGNAHSDETFVLFRANATNGFDKNYDAYKLFSTSNVVPSISTLSQNADLSINSLPKITAALTIPVRVKVGVSGTYTISADAIKGFPMSACIVLEDLLTGTKTDLKSENSYSFSISDTTKAPRFLLHVSAGIQKKYFSDDCEHYTAVVSVDENGPFTFTWKNNSGNILRTISKINSSDTLANLSAGKYFISVNDSNSICGSVTDTLIIPAQTPILTEFTATSDTTYFAAGKNISFTNYSSGAFSYLWKFGDGATSVNFNANHTYNTAGIYSITLITANETCTDSTTKTITVLDNPTDVQEKNSLKNNVHLLNDNNSYSLKFSFSNLSDITVSVINMLGQKIIPDQEVQAQNNTLQINFPSTAKGMYIINVRSNNQNIIFKVIR